MCSCFPSFLLLYVSLKMEALPLFHFNLLMRCCNLWMLFILSVTCFSSYCGACEPVICNRGRAFEYPFGSRNSGCGDPLLQVECDDNADKALLDISGTHYYILDYYPFNIWEGIEMTIIDKNLMGKECDPSSSNSTMQFWSSDRLHIVDGYQNITLWEGCTDAPQSALVSGCNGKFYYNTSSDMAWTTKCKSQVQLPVRQSVYPGPNLLLNIKEGFEIKWMPSSSCERCMSEKGTCAYNATNPFICNYTGKSNSRKTVLLACSIGGAVVVAVCVFLFSVYYVKRRKAQAIRGTRGINNYYQRTDMEAAAGNLSIFTYEELHQATNCFHENNELGDGGFGTVYLGNLEDGRTVAVKRLYQQNSRRMEQFINEVNILSSLHHPNLVQLYGCTSPQSPVLLLVYEFVSNGTLADHLHGSRRTPKGLPWEIRLNIAIETAQALSFLHSVNPPIFHRDVKSTNILLDENYRTKVADFGLSRLIPVDVSHVTTAPQGTPGYLDPEYHQCFQLTEKSDVYSFGVVLIELISAKLAVDITRNRNEISLANMAIEKNRAGALHELVDPDLKTETNHEVKVMVYAVAELAFECLSSDRDCRPIMKEVAERLEEIRLRYEKSDSEQQSSMSKQYSTKPPISPTSVQEEWPTQPSMASENTV